MSNFLRLFGCAISTFSLTSGIYFSAGALFGATPGNGFSGGGDTYGYADFVYTVASWSCMGAFFVALLVSAYAMRRSDSDI